MARSESHVLDSPDGLDALPKVLAGRYVLDAQVTESLAIQTYSILDQLPLAERSTVWAGRARAIDKINLAHFDLPVGFDTPPVLGVGAVKASDVVRLLSLPIVLKRRIGAGGNLMRIVHSERELDDLLNDIDDPDAWIVQKFVEGEPMCCAGVVTQDGAECLVLYEIVERKSPLGSSTKIKFVEDAGLERFASRLLSSLGLRGFVNVDFIHDRDGRNWIHDINPRIFGTYLQCQVAGYDLMESYVQFLRPHLDEVGSARLRKPLRQRSMRRDQARSDPRRRPPSRLVAYWDALGPLYCIDAAMRSGMRNSSRALRGLFGSS
jgi:hypothetical protein